jgi:hypothetical protein
MGMVGTARFVRLRLAAASGAKGGARAGGNRVAHEGQQNQVRRNCSVLHPGAS